MVDGRSAFGGGRLDSGAVGCDLHLVASGGGGSVTRFLW